MEDRERKFEWDRLQTEYGVPDELWQWVGDGVLQLAKEDEAKKTLTFTGPDNTILAWIHPDHNAEFCWRYVNVPGDCANFYLQRCSREHGDEDIDVPTLDDLIAWLENASDE